MTKLITTLILFCLTINGLSARTVIFRNMLKSISVNGDKIAWCCRKSLYLSNKKIFPEFTKYDLEPGNRGWYRLKWTNDGKVLYVLKSGCLTRFNFDNGKLVKDSVFTDSRLGQFDLLVNRDGSKIVVSFEGEATKQYIPGWRAGVELIYKDKGYEEKSIFTKQSEGTFVKDLLMDQSDRIYFSTSNGNRRGHYKKYESRSEGQNQDFYNCADNRILDVSSDGKYLLLSGRHQSLKDKSGDPLFTLFISEVNDGSPSLPKPVIVPHPDPILWHAQFSPDDPTIFWINLVRGDDGNKTIKREVTKSVFDDGKWGKPSVCFDIPNMQVMDYAISSSLIAVVNRNNQVIVFDRKSPFKKKFQIDMKL